MPDGDGLGRLRSLTISANMPNPSFASAFDLRSRSSANLISAKRPLGVPGRRNFLVTVPDVRPLRRKSKLNSTLAPLCQTAVAFPSRTSSADIHALVNGRLISKGVTPRISPLGERTAAAEGEDSNLTTAVFGGVAHADSRRDTMKTSLRAMLTICSSSAA